MKLVRPVVALATLACLAGGVTANAATKPVCNLVVDDKGDGSGVLADSDGLDILSADIASDSKKITAVIRLAGPPTKTLTTAAPEGGAYYFVFNAPGATNAVYLTWSNGLAGSEFAMGDVEGSIYTNKAGLVTGHIDGNNITMTVERGVFASLADIKPGVKLTNLLVQADTPIEVPGVGGSLQTADEASGTKSYTAGALSCVKPGK